MSNNPQRQAWFDAASFSPDAKLGFWEKMALGGTGFATSVPWVIFGFFLTFFYTDVIGMPGTLAGALILFARLFDAFTDALIGIFIDHFNFKWGKYRSWVLFSFIPQIVLFVMVFTALPDTTSTLQYIIAVIGYGFYGSIGSTLVFIPMNCMMTNMARNQEERASVSGYKGVWQNAGTIIAVLTFMPMAEALGKAFNSVSIGWLITGIFYALITTAPCLWIYILGERYELNSDGSYREHLRDLKAEAGQKVGLGVQFKELFKNRPAMVVVISTFIMYVLQGVRSGTVMYLYTHYYNQPQLASVALFFNCGTAMLGAVCVKYFVRLFKDSNRAYIMTIVGSSALYLVFYFATLAMGQEAAGYSMRLGGPLFIFYAICGFLQGAHYIFPNVMLPQAVDYGRYKFGRNQAGFVFAFFGVCLTVGGAFGGSVLGFFLGAIGYDPAFAMTSELAGGLLLIGVLVPALMGIAQAVIQLFYGFNDKTHKEYVAAIEAGKTEA